jgi:hypothetical protein
VACLVEGGSGAHRSIEISTARQKSEACLCLNRSLRPKGISRPKRIMPAVFIGRGAEVPLFVKLIVVGEK